MPTSHLSQNTWMSLKKTIGKGAKTGYGLGKDLQGIKRAVSTTPKHDRHGLWYQSGNQGRNEQMGRQKRNKMASSRLIIPLIHQTFRSEGYINSSLSAEDEDIVAPFLAFTINATTEKKRNDWECLSNCVPLPTRFWTKQLEHCGSPYCIQIIEVMQKLLYPSLGYQVDLLYTGLSFWK